MKNIPHLKLNAMKLEHFLTPYTKINSKWIKNLNVRAENIKLLEENIDKILSDINHSRILYEPPHRILEIKAKINKWDLKIKIFYTTKETISKVKRQPSEWEKMIAKEATDKELISIYFLINTRNQAKMSAFTTYIQRYNGRSRQCNQAKNKKKEIRKEKKKRHSEKGKYVNCLYSKET